MRFLRDFLFFSENEEDKEEDKIKDINNFEEDDEETLQERKLKEEILGL